MLLKVLVQSEELVEEVLGLRDLRGLQDLAV
jgi:hypothetical protein